MSKSTVTIQVTYPEGERRDGVVLDDPPMTADAALRLAMTVSDPLWGCHFRGFDETDYREGRRRVNANLRDWEVAG